MFRFSLRELLWITLAFASLTAWQLEARQVKHWREQAEHASSMLELQTLEQMALNGADPRSSPSYDPPLGGEEAGNQLPLGAAVLNTAFGWLP